MFGNEIQLWGKVFFSRDANWHLINDLCFWACSPIFKVYCEKKSKTHHFFKYFVKINFKILLEIFISSVGFIWTWLVQIVNLKVLFKVFGWLFFEFMRNLNISVGEIFFCIRIYMVQLLYVLFMAEWAFVRDGSILKQENKKLDYYILNFRTCTIINTA